ncbi:MAG: hypothetical protein ACRCX5_12265 [Bacteroidales bacterium]
MAKKWINPTRNEKGGKNKAYTTWYNLIKRNDVCEEWQNYDNFYDWFISNYKDGYSLQKDHKSVLSESTCRYTPNSTEEVKEEQIKEQTECNKVIDIPSHTDSDSVKEDILSNNSVYPQVLLRNQLSNIPLVQFKDKSQLRFEAYNRMMENHPEILCHATFSELFSIEVFRMAMLRLQSTLEGDGLYKQTVKVKYNNVKQAFDKYIANVYKNCYDHDEHLVRELIQDLEMDITKMYFSIKNHLDRIHCKYSASLAMLMTCRGLNDLICVMQDARESELRKIEPNLTFMPFMKPIQTVNPLASLTEEIMKNNKNGRTIDLNDDQTIKLAIRVIDTKVNSNERINEIVNNISKYRK